MTQFTLEIDAALLDLEKLASVDRQQLMSGVGFILERNIVEEVDRLGLVDQTDFRDSIEVSEVTESSVTVSDGVEHGIYLEEGTRPHVIKPRLKKALYWSGAEHPVKSVLHPGTRAYRPFRRGSHKSTKGIASFLSESLLKD